MSNNLIYKQLEKLLVKKEKLLAWINNHIDLSQAKTYAVYLLLNEDFDSKTLQSVLMTLFTCLEVFNSSVVANIICKNNIDFNDFINKPTALFFIIPDEIARSKNIYFQLVVQNLKQLTNKYGHEKGKIIASNCALHTFLTIHNLETTEYYSRLIGEVTKIKTSIAISEKSQSENQSLISHKLIAPSDLMRLKQNEAIVLFMQKKSIKN